MDATSELLIKGQVVFPAGQRPDAAARLVVRVQDVSRADAAAVTVAERTVDDVRLPHEDSALPFEISVPAEAVDSGGRYSLRVHVDVNGTGTVTPGDFVSTRSYPLQPERLLTVEVHQV